MAKSRRKPSYWRRTIPAAKFDVVKLRPKSLPRGKRFETRRDARKESVRSEALLSEQRRTGPYGTYVQECRQRDYHCEKTYCPGCARIFRRYIIGELLRLNAESKVKTWVLVVLLEAAPRGKLQDLQIERYRQSLRKRLDRAGLGGVPVVGGFEMIYRARSKEWVLHINLVIFGGDDKAIAKFEGGFRDGGVYRPVERTRVKDPAEQLSYVLKFTTYHRPHQQRGSKKSKALPLNPSEHLELVRWMSRYDFSDHLFLFNAKRLGASIEFSSKEARKA
jgi:hypothetical protein